jgi:hypothetical protein
MTPSAPLHYTRTELESYLPTGWVLAEGGAEGGWDSRRLVWRTTVLDGLDMEWRLEVTGQDASRLGRLPALAHAFDELNRHRLGRGTRGLGRSRSRAETRGD